MNWQQLATTSHFRTAVAVQNAIRCGEVQDALAGMEELIQAMSRSEKRALKSQLVRLMLHVIKWKTQPALRSLSWVASIKDARDEIADIQEETPSLNRAVIEALWDKAFVIAKRDAQAEMSQKAAVVVLSWQEVFEENYGFDEELP